LEPTLTLYDRLISLLDYLGVQSAHFAVQAPSDVSGLAITSPDRITGLLVCEAPGIDAKPFRGIASRIVFVAGDSGMSANAADAAHRDLDGSRRVVLTGYSAPVWADCVSDHTSSIVASICSLPSQASATDLPTGHGVHAEISYRIEGTGPALILMPLLLSPNQWDAAISELARHFTVIVLGGRHLSGVALLEGRAASASYCGMLNALLGEIAPAVGAKFLEVGCGSGALTRQFVRRYRADCSITALDINPFLLHEAEALARQDNLPAAIGFSLGNAESLPFPDASFDHAYTVTVLEECNADAALRELWRVVRPGGHVAVIVRAIDLEAPWSIALPDALRRKVESPFPMVSPGGVADRGLYRRISEAGFVDVSGGPSLATFGASDGPFWKFLEGRTVSRLDATERAVFEGTARPARNAGLLFASVPHHCAVARKPMG